MPNKSKPLTVPIIDIQPLRSEAPSRQQTVEQIAEACRTWGFFQITGHGISETLFARVWKETKGFFTLPLSAKQAVERTKANARGWYNRELTKTIRDMKEVFDFGYKPAPDLPDSDPANTTRDGLNQWPDAHLCPAFQSTMWEYFQACEHVALRVLETMAKGLGVSPDQVTKDFIGKHTSFLRLNYFPKHDPLHTDQEAAAKGHLGIHHHSDAGALTVLLQDHVGGLQIWHEEKWIPVEPVEGALVINIGDMVQVWTNDRYRATLHRVLASVEKERYSLPFFFNPSYESNYTPLEELTNETSPPKYRSINWGEFRWQRQQGDYANYGTENQISDYRIIGTLRE